MMDSKEEIKTKKEEKEVKGYSWPLQRRLAKEVRATVGKRANAAK